VRKTKNRLDPDITPRVDRRRLAGIVRMTTAAKLLARKRQLIDRLHKNPEPGERRQIDRFLAKIDTALSFLEEAELKESNRQRSGNRRLAKIGR
jgi:hypothetical protein